MKPTKLSFFLFILFLCIIFHAALCSANLYHAVCNEYRPRSDYNYCVRVLKSDSRIPLAKTYHDLSKLILELSINQAMTVQASFIEMAQHLPSEEALGQCAGKFYDESIESFNKALSNLDKDPLSSRTDAQDAGDRVIDCINALENTKEIYDPKVSYRNKKILFLSVMSFFAINHLT